MHDRAIPPRLRVLVAGDNHDDVALFGRVLENLGILVCDACSRTCLELALDFRPNLAFIEVAIPKTTGLNLAERLLDAPLPPLLLVARTGFCGDKIKDECLRAGFDFVVRKPDDFREVAYLLRVARHLAEPALKHDFVEG